MLRRSSAVLLLSVATLGATGVLNVDERPASAGIRPALVEHQITKQTDEQPQRFVNTSSTVSSYDLELQIASALISQEDAEREVAFDTSLPELLARDPATIDRLLAHCAPGLAREELLKRIVQAWTALNVEEAIEWINTLQNDDRDFAAKEISREIARYDVPSAIEVADRFRIGRDDGTLEHLVQLWAAESLPTALSWIKAQPAGPDRDQLLARIVWVQTPTRQAGNGLAEHYP